MCLFRVGCVMLSFCAIVWNIYIFSLDEDSVEITVKDTPLKKDIFHPTLMLCFHQKIVNRHKVFIGRPSSKDQLQDKSDHRIFHINDYIGNIVVKYKNENRAQMTKTVPNVTPYEEVQYTGHSRKIMLRRLQSSDCLDIDIPSKKKETIHSIDIAIKDDAFRPKDLSPLIENWIAIGFTVQNSIFMLPNSFLMPNEKLNPPELDSHQKRHCSRISFHVKGIETLHRRNKPTNPCINSYRNGALPILKYAARRIKCVPNGWEIAHVLPNCKDKKLDKNDTLILNKIRAALNFFLYSTKFCRSMRNIQIEPGSSDSNTTCTEDVNTKNITMIYGNYTLTETRLVRSYTVTNLLFNIGYIIGLFLGLSLIQLPVIFTKRIRTICRKVQALITKKEPEASLTDHIPNQNTDVLDGHMDEINIKLTLANQEIQNLKKDSCLFKNHILQMRALVLLQEQEYETVL